ENYVITFALRADAPRNTLEFKLVDPSGENVWWARRVDFDFPAAWDTLSIRKRHVAFAWGPAGGGELRRTGSLEIVVTAGTGGAGTVWIDDLAIRELPPRRPYDLTPSVSATGTVGGSSPSAVLDGDATTAWRAASGAALTIDFLRVRELGGLVLDWEVGRHAPDYVVAGSEDGRSWRTLREVRRSDGGRDYLFLPETDARFLRLDLTSPAGRGYVLREIDVHPLDWAASRNAFFEAVAADAPRGAYPRYLLGELPYWTVTGVSGDAEEALVGEDGGIEPFRGGFSLEPFLRLDGRLLSWADVERETRLADGSLPIPSVRWRAPGTGLELAVEAVPVGAAGASTLLVRYTVVNRGPRAVAPTLFVAVRPFQVNPSTQFLNGPGGYARIDSLVHEAGEVRVNGRRRVVPLTAPTSFGGATFDEGGVGALLGALDPSAAAGPGGAASRSRVVDPFGAASGALAYRQSLASGDSATVDLAVPWHDRSVIPAAGDVDGLARAAKDAWRARLARAVVELPGEAAEVAATLRTTQGYILVNQDGPAIQPGSRAYARSWIRDGALTSAALLRLGHHETVREFLLWYADFVYPSGKVPCCVDERGADPVPEHDSGGELIYLVMEYFRHTGDEALLERLWPRVRDAVAYMDSLRHTRLTDAYRTPQTRVFYGLLPESISHEGYSAKPMHSYWDQLWALRGFEDAAAAADTLGLEGEAARIGRIRDAFRADLAASFRRAMAIHAIDYLPGAAELGDFDATSTTIALTPVAADWLPPAALDSTFGRYLREFRARRDGGLDWDAYTPYELRTVGTFVRLGRPDVAHELLAFFMGHRRPDGWNQWAEVVWRDARLPRFIGDMPHTWVGSDFIRSVMDMVVYEREADDALLVGAGIPPAWLEGRGLRVEGLSTHWGRLDLSARREGRTTRIALSGTAAPPGGFVLRGPLLEGLSEVRVDGSETPVVDG
ncbi:MAG: coagulation factor 5/8 type domain-containing protein, partial [Gemmatimonadetes bacterium]|nr:coagulation factor 5/8 type domain-containing protein [Gemmatimonadota bacterium]NIQ55822.1 coagulation factor 5/8 type domain-containing protein [Gemmatimonadota bacterium]NIX45600.1 coagulation factor 5/8 type domain-containing protein [Gemmatimonadota bacterium]NIY09889.1 coagulation factor 5/8 type domain-containing protein [Gemmatimonadota bacterium]